ncbi:MAG: hypothetical protein JW903_05220 [Clostridia bacterium]|nr:hypothetical protein [Clostridia bacterium]
MKLFGPPLKDVYAGLAAETEALFIPGSFAKSPAVAKQYGNFRILLDTYTVNTGKSSVTYTRMRVPFKRENDIQFKLTRKNIFSGISSLFGMQVIGSYDYDFDDKYIIKGNDETVVKEIFQNEELRKSIAFQKNLVLKVHPYKEKKSRWSSEIYFQVTGVIKDVEKLKNLFHMFMTLIDELMKQNVALNEKSDIIL